MNLKRDSIPADRDRVLTAVREHLEERKPYDVDYRLRTNSGEYRWFHARGQALWDASGRAVRMLGSIADITRRKRIEQRSAALHDVIQILAEQAEPTKAFPMVLRSLCHHLDWTLGVYWALDPAAGVLRAEAMHLSPHVYLPRFVAMTKALSLSRDEGLPGRAWLSKRPEWIRDVTLEKSFPRARAAAEDDLHCAVALPILIGDNLCGVMEFVSTLAAEADPELLKVLGAVTLQISQALLRDQDRRRADAITRETTGAKSPESV